MSIVTYRRLDSNYEPVFGQGQNDFTSDLAAVAQAIQTRLNLWLGEWWEDLNDGLPMLQGILGKMGAGQSGEIPLLIQERILGTPYVTEIINVKTLYNKSTRQFSFSCGAVVAFGGQLTIVGTFANSNGGWTVTPSGG